ncbi:MAG: T9SS type A sorting domain-containing protein [Bacteroidetes bacterium]|nr:T9SS type A sorting domain-containing protein [Bacteroidota bacterium]
MKISKVLYPGDSTIDVTYYKLNLTLTYSPNYLKGIVTVNAKSNLSGLNSFFLDLQNAFTIDSILSNGKKLTFIHSNAKLNIALDKNYNAGEIFSVVIYYEGVPGSSGFGSFAFGSHAGSPAIWSLSEPYGASDWWPCKDTPADKADSSDVWITCDKSLTAASNGILQTVVDNGNGTHTFEWKNSYPIAQYLISIAISNYTVYKNYYDYSVSDSMPITNYVYPEDFSSSKYTIDKVPNMIKIYSDYYGQYPFLREKYGQAQFGWGGGMEHQTITSLGDFDEDLEAHELAHQWFGDMVTCKDWQDIWLNEGFATYSEAIYFGTTQGENVYNQMISQDMQAARNAVGSIYVQDISSVDNIFDYSRTYAKGAVVLHMLRGIVGDSTFFKILRSYASYPGLAYNVAATSDFESVAEKIYGSSLSYFFNEWIYGENYPHYQVSWNSHLIGNNVYDVTLNISQTDNSNPLFFTMPIQIKISTSVGDTIVTVLNDQQDQKIDISINGEPNYIDFDPNNFILKDISIMDSIDLTKPKTFSLEQNYPNPFNPATTIEYTIPVQYKGYIPVKLIIYNILGSEVDVLVNVNQSSGTYRVSFPSKDKIGKLSSGVYFYALFAGNYRDIKKMVLTK